MQFESLIFSLAEWTLLALAIWWVAGFVLWYVAIHSHAAPVGHVARRLAPRLALPGARQLATVTAAAGLVVLPACTAEEPTPRLTYLGEVVDLAPAPTLPPTTAMPTTTAEPQPPRGNSTDSAPTDSAPTDSAPTDSAPTDSAPTDSEARSPEPTSEGTTVEPSRPLTHEVRPGEHLWGIAAEHLGSTTEAPPTNSQIATYWRRLIMTNAGTIRSGDPDLVHPGEVLTLPPIEAD